MDPLDNKTFWIFNEYAEIQGTGTPPEDGRWGTAWLSIPDISAVPKHAIILIDRTGSMRAEGRCQAALDYAAADIVNFFAGNAGGSAAVWTFTGSSATELTNGFEGRDEALAAVAGLSGDDCDGWTPLAQAICEAVDALTATFPGLPATSRVLYINSDGGENNSSGECSGPDSESSPPPSGNYTPGSWQQKTYDKIINAAVTNVRYWGALGSVALSPVDAETGLERSIAAVSDETFFMDIAAVSGGTYEGIMSVVACHDSVWEEGEYCGFDARVATGKTEMNHDCYVDDLDLFLFMLEYGPPGLIGPYLSGDFNGDGVVNLADLNALGDSYEESVSPCTSTGLPDVCEGSISLSFSSDPETIVSSQVQSPGPHQVYLVINGWNDAQYLEYSCERSPNVYLSGLEVYYPVRFSYDGGFGRYHIGSTAPWPSGPITFAVINYYLFDSEPGWIRLGSSPSPLCLQNTIRWATIEANRYHHFETIGNVQINPDITACEVVPSSIDFGTVFVGSTKDTTFSIINVGADTLSGIVNETCAHYSIVSGGGEYALLYGQSVNFTLRFEPTTTGTHNCTVETGDALCSYVSLTGVGDDQPVCVVEPDAIDFGTVAPGDSLDMVFDVINVGGGLLSGSVSDTCAYFDVVAGEGTYALASGDTLHVAVRFRPEASGVFECWIETGMEECGDVYCTGEGDVMPGIEVVDANRFYLYQNHPNPFNPTTTISFSLAEKTNANLSIYNLEGKRVVKLVENVLDEGLADVTWDGKDSRGNPVSSGVYFYRLTAGNQTLTRKMVLLK